MKQSTDKTDDRIYDADGRSHFVHYVTDENGNKVATVTGPLKVEFRMQDLAQLVAGACVMAMPVSLTEEVWNLGTTLSISHTLMILCFSILALCCFIWGLFYGKQLVKYHRHFIKRAVSAYLVTFCVAFLLLFLFEKAPLNELRVTLTRTIIVAFPASFAATAVDFMN